jgi:hypothetical protein
MNRKGVAWREWRGVELRLRTAVQEAIRSKNYSSQKKETFITKGSHIGAPMLFIS